MAVRVDFTKAAQKLSEEIERKRETVRQTLAYIGESAVTVARKDHPNNYNDITGNLRSSVGYSILIDGAPSDLGKGKTEQFAGEEGDGSEGFSKAESFLNKMRTTSGANDMELVVVAAMEYASAVEYGHRLENGNSTMPRDVLKSAKIQAELLAEDLLKSFKK